MLSLSPCQPGGERSLFTNINDKTVTKPPAHIPAGLLATSPAFSLCPQRSNHHQRLHQRGELTSLRPARDPLKLRGFGLLLPSSTGSLKPQRFAAKRKSSINGEQAQKHPLNGDNPPPVGLPIVTRAGPLHTDICSPVLTLISLAVTQCPGGWPVGTGLGDRCVSLWSPRFVPSPSRGDVALGQPALGWQMKPPAI